MFYIPGQHVQAILKALCFWPATLTWVLDGSIIQIVKGMISGLFLLISHIKYEVFFYLLSFTREKRGLSTTPTLH